MKKRIAFFDFDGTITTKDSLLSFIIFRRGKLRTFLGLLTVSPYYAAHLLKIISVKKAKEHVLKRFFKNERIEKFNTDCDAFVKDILPSLLRPKAVKEIQSLRENGVEVVIVSASADNWIQPWSKQFEASLICTKLETKDGKLTGRIEGDNCRGKEKVRRIQLNYNLSEYDEVLAYGDTKGDKPMLGLATIQFYQPFR
jgi:phosphatidylglycerophosphatase C